MKGIKWLLGLLAGGVFAFLIMMARGLFAAQTMDQKLLCVCDGFSVSGLLFLCVGIMSLIAGEGIFDVFGYAIRKGLHHILPGGAMEDTGSFYDYKMKKSEKKAPRSQAVMLTTGAIYLLIGIILIFVWNEVTGL